MLGYGHNIERTEPLLNTKTQVEPRDTNSTNHAADAHQPSLQANSTSITPLEPSVVKPHTNVATEPTREQQELAQKPTGTNEEGTASATQARRPSIAETLLATAATAAVSAASTVVTAARKLVVQDDDGTSPADTEERNNQGLTFSQRHMSLASRRVDTKHPIVGASGVGEPNTQTHSGTTDKATRDVSITSHLPEILAAASASATGAHVAASTLPVLDHSRQSTSRPRGDDDAMKASINSSPPKKS